VELVVVEVAVVGVPAVLGAFLGVLASFPVVFPVAPDASLDILVAFALVFLSWCLPFATAAASERQQRDLF
jgi:4-amino-4-deoxy-L-arabinose transferase-like glycosyltransferase